METKPNNSIVIADSNALISRTITTDTNHEPAKSAVQEAACSRQSIIIPAEVFRGNHESVGQEVWPRRAIEAVHILLAAAIFLVEPTLTWYEAPHLIASRPQARP